MAIYEPASKYLPMPGSMPGPSAQPTRKPKPLGPQVAGGGDAFIASLFPKEQAPPVSPLEQFTKTAQALAQLKVVRERYKPDYSYDYGFLGGPVASVQNWYNLKSSSDPNNPLPKERAVFWKGLMSNYLDALSRSRSGGNVTEGEMKRFEDFMPQPEYDDVTNQHLFDEQEAILRGQLNSIAAELPSDKMVEILQGAVTPKDMVGEAEAKTPNAAGFQRFQSEALRQAIERKKAK